MTYVTWKKSISPSTSWHAGFLNKNICLASATKNTCSSLIFCMFFLLLIFFKFVCDFTNFVCLYTVNVKYMVLLLFFEMYFYCSLKCTFIVLWSGKIWIQTIRAIRLVCYPNYSNMKINIVSALILNMSQPPPTYTMINSCS